jgi:lysophospholipase-1
MTALTGLSSERKLAGLAILSGWTPIRNTLKQARPLRVSQAPGRSLAPQMLSAHYKSLPIFWGHGTDDPLVEVGAASRDWLHAAGVADAPAGEPGLSFNAYEGITHSTSPQELDDLKAFLIKVLPAEE